MTSPLQFKTALVGIETCRSVLGRDEDFVMALIENGGLKFAFNVAAPKAHRAEVRVLSLSLLDHVNGTSSQPSRIDDVLRYAIPVAASFSQVKAKTLCRGWCISPSHVTKLIATGCLNLARERAFRTETACITLESARRFLVERRIV